MLTTMTTMTTTQQTTSMTIEDCFKKTVVLPHLISNIISRFNKHTRQVAPLLPRFTTATTSVDDIQPAIDFQ